MLCHALGIDLLAVVREAMDDTPDRPKRVVRETQRYQVRNSKGFRTRCSREISGLCLSGSQVSGVESLSPDLDELRQLCDRLVPLWVGLCSMFCRAPKGLNVPECSDRAYDLTRSPCGLTPRPMHTRPPPQEHLVIFARHAESWSNLAESDPRNPSIPIINPSDPLGPWGDLPLTELGAHQADILAQKLATTVTDIYASAQIRTFQTARAVAIAAGLPVNADWNLREISLPQGDRASVSAYLTAVFNGERRSEKIGRGAESYNDEKLRVNMFWRRFVAERKGTPGTSLVVTHSGIMMLFVSQICSNREKLTSEFLQENSFDYTGLVKATLTNDGVLTCSEWAGKSLR
ncbi:bifunctional RNase H/acid phosphatase [Mycobacteroides abscessus subsp. massiliense]|nr:bifunctional RNase H/acid phosphatase [Mycobacteroides abscessus subsp. massiliense]SKH92608.1 bifunctional RNase H/acid phosphatase [Mycobacteroides abscessus subsp. massiliense]SKI13334.1 bifunctional RNase H/acid phosphatase [Mycobacteroides abscessus subsp. massiliense]SKK30014.1 bifunctional RNase H/acid phosphatase [Mycobacteroides abscessus subsp. massiliense]SKK36476.1 bifunctional RNase H/acid phosphatase [Mycobacteroides abscessus subsp. massiliense]